MCGTVVALQLHACKCHAEGSCVLADYIGGRCQHGLAVVNTSCRRGQTAHPVTVSRLSMQSMQEHGWI